MWCYVRVSFPTGGERYLVTLSDDLPTCSGYQCSACYQYETGVHGLVQTQLAATLACLDEMACTIVFALLLLERLLSALLAFSERQDTELLWKLAYYKLLKRL